MSKSTHHSKVKDRKCVQCFQYNERYRRNCEYCGAEMPKTKRRLTLVEKIKRLLGI